MRRALQGERLQWSLKHTHSVRCGRPTNICRTACKGAWVPWAWRGILFQTRRKETASDVRGWIRFVEDKVQLSIKWK
jgi:hypothetical protein